MRFFQPPASKCHPDHLPRCSDETNSDVLGRWIRDGFMSKSIGFRVADDAGTHRFGTRLVVFKQTAAQQPRATMHNGSIGLTPPLLATLTSLRSRSKHRNSKSAESTIHHKPNRTARHAEQANTADVLSSHIEQCLAERDAIVANLG